MWNLSWFNLSEGIWEGLAPSVRNYHFVISHLDYDDPYTIRICDEVGDDWGIVLGDFDNLPSAQLCAERVIRAVIPVGQRVQ